MKKFYIEGSIFERDYVTYDELTPISNIGTEVTVYRYKDLAFKIFKTYTDRPHLSRSDIEYMSKIDTKRILLPKYCIKEEKSIGQIDGYAMKFIPNNENILYVLMEDLLKELRYVEEDIKKLSEYLISIHDLTLKNYIYSNGLYLIDPGSYEVDRINHLETCYDIVNTEKIPKKDKQILIEAHNYETFDKFVLNILILSYLISEDKLSYFKKLSKYLRSKKRLLNIDSYLDVLEEENCKNMTVKEYVKQIYSKVI